ncbi:hypothetical protein MIND_01133700 [Mycena indigotica]|uniref:Uncharacterized protein n=1 Tax=Mycena indigotica TaxID=2126181 RepID=A0A8H6VTP0_9AGAR|nr:uncharacterized protein MIND_01133700 [Mycena indigotica]KAF7293552.1 hypothetical protein MIND_01133700 [Mycena indigotica]
MTPSVTSYPAPALTMIDILGVIFEACLTLDISVEWQNDVRQKMALGAVCRCWKLALESIPALWSCIILVPRMPQYYIDKVFRLAKATPKRLRIDIYSELAPTFLSSIAAPLVATAETVTHLCVEYYSHSVWDTFVDHLSQAAANPPSNFALLRSFYATPHCRLWPPIGPSGPQPFRAHAADLRHLHLDGLPPSSFVVGSNLISLAITNLDLTADDPPSTFATNLLDSLHHTPRLETLLLDVNEPFFAQSISHHRVVLPRLSTLSFRCTLPFPHLCGMMLSLVHLPTLHTLSLGLTAVENSNNFISANETHLSTITVLRLIGDVSAYIDVASGQAKLLSSLTASSRLRDLDFLDAQGLFAFEAERNALVQTQFLEILAHALTLPAVRLLIITPLLLPPYPLSHQNLIQSLLEPVSMQGGVKYIFEEHALCPASGGEHSNCGRLWSWDYEGLRQATRASHSKYAHHITSFSFV